MEEKLDILKTLLTEYYDAEEVQSILIGLSLKKFTTFRVNTMKCNRSEVEKVLLDNNIDYEKVNFYDDAFAIKDTNFLFNSDLFKYGKIYVQNLSSMVPPIIINPQKNESILDMTAAPGSKTTEIYNLSNAGSLITAVEKDAIRFERLKYNLELQGAKRVGVLNISALNLPSEIKYDKILLDAPCSGSGTINETSKFNKKLVENSHLLQEKLLKKAVDMLNPGGILVYSTCSVLKLENEINLYKYIENKKLEVIPIEIKLDKSKVLPSSISGTLTLAPNEYYEGFFIACLKKLQD